MRRTILAGIIAASVGVPAVAMAKVDAGFNAHGGLPSQQLSSQQLNNHVRSPNGASIGAGMEGIGTGHVTGPGNSPIDNSIHAPINDLQPGHGTTDTRQNANPKPAY